MPATVLPLMERVREGGTHTLGGVLLWGVRPAVRLGGFEAC